MIRLVLKVGTQAARGLHDGMLVCTLDPAAPVSVQMRTAYALVDVPDTWADRVRDGLAPVGTPHTPEYRARAGYVSLQHLAWALGDPDLEFQWRAPGFVVAPRPALDVPASLLAPTVGVVIPHRLDHNAVSEGNYTVGTGGDYATWSAAAADVAASQTGDLNFLQISSHTESAAASFAHALAGNTLTLTSCEPPWGAPDAGFVTTLSAASVQLSMVLTGAGIVNVERLYLRASFALAVPMIDMALTGAATGRVRDCLLDGDGFLCDGVATSGNAVETYEVYNTQVWDVDGIGFNIGAPAAAATVENCTAYLCLTNGFAYVDDVSVTLQNCAAFDSSPGADFNVPVPVNAITATNASSDASAPGGGSLVGLTAAVEYVSLLDTLITFLKVAPASSMTVAGTAALIAGNTIGHRGNGTTPTPTIGADEFLSTLYVTLGNCIIPSATLEGVGGVPGPTYQGIVEDNDLVSTSVVPVSAFPLQVGIPNTITVVADLLMGQGFSGQANLSGTITATAAVIQGDLRVTKVTGTTPEARRAVLGFLPSTPLLVHSITASTPAEVENANIGKDEHFLVNASFIPSGGDPFSDAGAKAGSIGTKRIVNPIFHTFRPAAEYEVVWFIKIDTLGNRQDCGLYRYEPDDDGAFRWVEYRSMPQRALDGQLAFDFLDPDDIYDYYAKLLAAVLTEWQDDNLRLLTLLDAQTCPPRLLNFLGEQFGLSFDSDDTVSVKRERIGSAIPTFKLKGQEASYLLRLRSLGYRADVREVWVDPTDVDNWNAEGEEPAAITADIAARGLTGQIDPNSGQKGQDFILPPHGYFTGDPPEDAQYYPSSRIALFLNDIDGNPLSSSISAADLTALRNRVTRELRDTILPAHVDIRFFGTRVPIADGDDTLEITDAMAFANVVSFPFFSEIVLTPTVSGTLGVSA